MLCVLSVFRLLYLVRVFAVFYIRPIVVCKTHIAMLRAYRRLLAPSAARHQEQRRAAFPQGHGRNQRSALPPEVPAPLTRSIRHPALERIPRRHPILEAYAFACRAAHSRRVLPALSRAEHRHAQAL